MVMPSDKAANAVTEPPGAPPPAASGKLSEAPPTFTLWQKVQIAVASWVGYLAVALIGRSLRFEIHGWENWEVARKLGQGMVYTFWHEQIFAATWFWRKRGIVVMSGLAFDSQYTARIIRWHGFGVARGSASRGGKRAFLEMVRRVRAGADAAFTIDGPRGPRYVAKPGSVLLAKATGAAILCFHIALRHAYVFRKSWDQTQIPYPFSKAAIFIAPPLVVSRDADDQELARKVAEVQATLDELRRRGEHWAGIY
jgi:hypothetical protein